MPGLKTGARRALNGMLAVAPLRALARRLARAGLFPQRLWSGYPINEMVEYSFADLRFRYDVVHGDYVGMPLYWMGAAGYEPETAALMARLLAKARLFFDIGANTGFYTLFAARANPHLRVVAFEPSPATFARLKHHIAVNAIGERVRAVPCAVGDVSGRAPLFIPSGRFALSASLSELGMAADRERVEVETVTIDRFCASQDAPDVVKIDVEGLEDRVLMGMRETLRRARPSIVLEVLVDGPNRALTRLLAAEGYRFGQITRSGVSWSDELSGANSRHGRNWLCLPAGGEPASRSLTIE